MNPRTKHYLIIGGIAAGALVVVMVVTRRGSTSTGTTSGVIASGTTGASSGSVSTSQLATFEQSVSSALSSLQTQMASGFTQLASLGGPGSAGNPTNPSTGSGSSPTGTGSSSAGGGGGPTPSTPTPSPTPKTTTTKKLTWANQGYSWVSNFATAQADLAAGEQLYFNAAGPKGGQVVPVKYRKGMKLPKATTLEVKG